ncbi:response regulator [Mucilaginibacter sp.]|uniref:response regulator n=1 Tax=Mucilaginibacter sp. TaxID=1882438 RepID=UPI003AFFE2B7
MNTLYLLASAENLLMIQFWLTWWFYLLVLMLALIGGYIFYTIKINMVLHEVADLERQLLERTELLSYSKLTAQKAQEDAALANRNKSTLITKISHDIRTPMNTIMGMASLLNETTLNTEQQEYSSTIFSSGENLLAIINGILMDDLLEYSKMESGRELESKDFDLRNNIEEVFDVFSVKAAQQHIELLYYIEPDVPVQLIGDAMRLRQILMNLVENALSFKAKGEIYIVVGLVSKPDDHRVKLGFEVRDTSAGLAPEILIPLAADLQSETENNTTAIGKTLNICKKLVRLFNGSLSVTSEKGKGNIFKFTMITSYGKQNSRANTQTEMAKHIGKKILVADNNATLASSFQFFLEKWKFTPFVFGSGRQALEAQANAGRFDLAIVDMMMPEMNGIELAKALKQMQPDLPVILMNKPGNDTYKEQAGLFSAVVDKPLKHHIISGHILSLLGHNGNAGADQTSKQKLSVDFAKSYPLNILIAEDDKMNQKLVTKVLNKLGYEPQVAENGKDVLEIVSNKTYDLILMDVQMPEMDGLEATRMIRLCLTEQPVIIAMTANTLQGDREECLKAGMDDYIGKPVRLDGLVNIIEKWALQSQQKQ